MATAQMSHADLRTSTMSRITQDGRKLTYTLTVIQQPERARACGSGAKSSADRRPVDPPPVVELRIFENDGSTDITFSHDANFHLFATLEPARPIAHGRVSQPLQASSPVLTGIPVSSMAHLERPTPAGYFIFPDLSVRHEGKYKLVFNLYEEVKELKDADVEFAHNHPEHPNNKRTPRPANSPKEFHHWRLEVQSSPFTVFSAKKFPGLSESTSLSRIVAEQGCRVRIRRDVRMRRRDTTKSSKDFDEYEEERQASPADYQHDQRIPPATSQPVDQHFGMDRRQSAHDPAFYGSHPQYPQQQSYQAPPAPQTAQPASQVGFSSQPQYQAPQYTAAPSMAAPPQPTYADNRYNGYQDQQPQPNLGYPYSDRSQSLPEGQYQAPSHARTESIDAKPVTEWRSSTSYPYSKPSEYAYSAPHPNFSGYGVAPLARSHTPSALAGGPLPPLKMSVQLESKYDAAGASANQPHPSPAYDPTPRSNSYSQYPSTPPAAEAGRSTKRAYATAFDASHSDQPLSNGARPSEEMYGTDMVPADYSDDDQDSPHPVRMQYKRADGTEILRKLTTTR
ncbi:MAG: velvet protein [Vezdaea aestivalis]|nr:MAG: velvet protein [Vezdaea aestivalis]